MNTNSFALYSTCIIAGITIGLLVSTTPASSDSLPPLHVQPGYVACTDEVSLSLYDAAQHREQVGMMMDDLCLPTERLSEFPFVVLAQSGQTAEVRILLPDDRYADLYMPIEATMSEADYVRK